MQALIDESCWQDTADLAQAYIEWSGYAYGAGAGGVKAKGQLERRLQDIEAVLHNQDNREHDLLDSDDYYQFEGGMVAAVDHISGRKPVTYHNDHSRPENPRIFSLSEEIARTIRARGANPKWISGVMRHGYKGAFEIAATVDYLFAFAATTGAVDDRHFDLLFEAYIEDKEVLKFLKNSNVHAMDEIAQRFMEALNRGLWQPKSNSALATLISITEKILLAKWKGLIFMNLTEEEFNRRANEKSKKRKAAREKILAKKTVEKGLLIVHTGKGKGKSTAAFGLAARAIGNHMRVGVVQFVKGKWETGERHVLEQFPSQVDIRTMGEGFTWDTQDRARDIDAARAAWEASKEMIEASRADAIRSMI